MKTLKEIKELVEKGDNSSGFLNWYQYAIKNILEDIRNSKVTSVESIEKYLLDLMNK